jgi:FtsH-binding integral membrane protein
MEERNPYRDLTAPPVAFAAAAERATFLKKVYGILLLGVLGFAATLWSAANVPVANDLAMKVGNVIHGSRWGWLIYMAVFMGGSYAVHAVAQTKPINAIAFGVWVVLLGFLTAPLVLWIGAARGPEIISQASGLTALVFGGLTVYVLWSGKDFSFLRGALTIGFWSILAVSLIGTLTGFTPGLWVSYAIVLLFAGYILYDTSTILHQLPSSMAMTGAILLFTDVVLLFKHILVLLARDRD